MRFLSDRLHHWRGYRRLSWICRLLDEAALLRVLLLRVLLLRVLLLLRLESRLNEALLLHLWWLLNELWLPCITHDESV